MPRSPRKEREDGALHLPVCSTAVLTLDSLESRSELQAETRTISPDLHLIQHDVCENQRRT